MNWVEMGMCGPSRCCSLGSFCERSMKNIAWPSRSRYVRASATKPSGNCSSPRRPTARLAIYPESTFAQWADRLASGSPTARDVRDYRRLFFSQACSTKLDRQGRLRIPQVLVEWATLEGEVVLLGVQDHVELWKRGLGAVLGRAPRPLRSNRRSSFWRHGDLDEAPVDSRAERGATAALDHRKTQTLGTA